MSYSIILRRTGEVFGLDDEDGLALQEKWMEAKKPFPVQVADNTFMSNEIARITKNKPDWLTNDIVNAVNRGNKLSAGNKCEGSTSMALAIIGRAKTHGGIRMLKDPKWREEQRQAIIKADPKKLWCDNKAGTCACPKPEVVHDRAD